jgi:hypothetical protein
MIPAELQSRVDELAALAVDLEEVASLLRYEASFMIDDRLLDLILELRPPELPPIDLDAWLASDLPMPEVAPALGL